MALPAPFRWVEQRATRYEAMVELPTKGSGVHFTSSGLTASASRVEAQATSWLADQGRVEDDALTREPVKIEVMG